MCYLLRCKYNIYVNDWQVKERIFSCICEFYRFFFHIYIKLYIFASKIKYNVYVKSKRNSKRKRINYGRRS